LSKNLLAIDIGSTKISVIIAETKNDDFPHIIGTGVEKSLGLKKGTIVSIEDASKSIKKAIETAKRSAGISAESAVVSLSGAYAKGMSSIGVVNVPDGEIGIKEIQRAIETSIYRAAVPSEYEVVHALPYMFKVDEQDFIEDPLGMNGARLEASVYIIMAHKSALNNLRRAIENAGVSVDNFVLSGYASSLSVLNSDDKQMGVAVIDMGGTICDLVVHTRNAINYINFLNVGSENITKDISIALGTTLTAAESTKVKYGSLSKNEMDMQQSVELPILSDEGSSKDISVDIINKIIYARVEETLTMLNELLQKSNSKDGLGAGVVLTGGMTNLEGIRELASEVFKNLPVRISQPLCNDDLYESIKEPSFSTAVGLIFYANGKHTKYEIDSNQKLKYKSELIVNDSHSDLHNLKEIGGPVKDISDKDFPIHMNESPKMDRDILLNGIGNEENDMISKIKNWAKNLF
jgi:cell division protein FtsA